MKKDIDKEVEICDCCEVHENLLQIVNETIPEENELYDLAELFKVCLLYTSCFSIYNSNCTFVAGAGTEPAAVAFFFIYMNDFSCLLYTSYIRVNSAKRYYRTG